MPCKLVVIPVGARLLECQVADKGGKIFLRAVRDKGANLVPLRSHDFAVTKFQRRGAWVKYAPAIFADRVREGQEALTKLAEVLGK